MTVLITGAAGFIGMHTSLALQALGQHVVAIDNLNDYYDVTLKQARLCKLKAYQNGAFFEVDISDYQSLFSILKPFNITSIIHLAAQAGVRYSIDNPHVYADANLKGFLNLLEIARHFKVEHFVFASSSSVYGGNPRHPFKESHPVDHPISLYAATKKANEVMAHSYSHLYQIPTTGLRFFTVYGPWGRPDMAPFLFTKAILAGKPIDIFNNGELMRDFTYIDDIVEGILRVHQKPATPVDATHSYADDPSISNAPFRLFNIGNSTPTPLMTFINTLETALGVEAIKNYLPMQPGDVLFTGADTSRLEDWIGYKPTTPLHEGVARFVEWYRAFYQEGNPAHIPSGACGVSV